MMLAAWVHDIDPFIFKITDTFGPRWYGMAYAAGFVVGYLVLRWLARRNAALVPVERVGDAIVYLALGVVVGGRVGYAVFYQPSLLWTFTDSMPWWNLLNLAHGGMARHGGMIGTIVAAWFIARGWTDESGTRIGRAPLLHVLDLVCLLAPFGLFFGRIANFINGELLGKVVALPGEPAPWWAVRFPQEIGPTQNGSIISDHMTPQIFAGLGELIRPLLGPNDTIADGYARLVEKVQHGSPELAAQLGNYLSARHPSQLYQALAEGVLVGLVVWFIARKPRLPGVVGCWFLISYGLLRVLTEVWRLPDAHLAVGRPAGLSRGQWLSVLMMVIGVVLLIGFVRRGGERIGGWLTPALPADPVASPATTKPRDQERHKKPTRHKPD